ncbi:hypothetical protein N0V88_006599 [Collariella sp. IMI 366227]|nr:hypothetical protein N0V88_006599 [Collariella sp. IMI 366227]
MQHVDRKSLYTNLEARIRYLHSFLDFGAGDIEALRSGSKYIQALIPAVVNIVYRKLLQYDITARAFTTRSTAFEGPMDTDPDELSPQILHRNSAPTPLHIEYIHIGAGLAVIQDILCEAILSHPRLHIARKIAIVKALGKVIWIQNDLFTKWYVHDGEEFTDGMDYEAIVEKEGYLHGKKVLAHEDEISGEEEGASIGDDAAQPPVMPAKVPFAGYRAGGGKEAGASNPQVDFDK